MSKRYEKKGRRLCKNVPYIVKIRTTSSRIYAEVLDRSKNILHVYPVTYVPAGRSKENIQALSRILYKEVIKNYDSEKLNANLRGLPISMGGAVRSR